MLFRQRMKFVWLRFPSGAVWSISALDILYLKATQLPPAGRRSPAVWLTSPPITTLRQFLTHTFSQRWRPPHDWAMSALLLNDHLSIALFHRVISFAASR